MNLTDRADVFVSYRHLEPTQSWVRTVLVPAVEAAGYSVIIDVRDFVQADVLLDEIERASTRGRITMAIVDDSYADSGFTEFERRLGRNLLVVARGDLSSVPLADRTVDCRHSDDPRPIVDVVDEMIKRVFVLESEADETWVRGFLLPALWRADVDAVHVGDLATDDFEIDALDRRIEWADRVIVVLSPAYVLGRAKREGARLHQYETARDVRKSVPVVLTTVADEQLPKQFGPLLRIDMSDRSLWDAALGRICGLLDVPTPRRDEPPECPYPGMSAYPDDGRYPFVGRDDKIGEVVARLEQGHVAAVVGPSGSGKSSLVRAGVLPRVRTRGLAGRPRALIEIIRPTDDPAPALRSLAVTGTRPDEGVARVLVVDQLEEAFSLRHDGAAFLRTIVERRRADPDLFLVVTVRADFYAPLMLSPIWPDLAPWQVEVTPLSGRALKAAIREPAAHAGAVIDEALVVQLANETEGQPGLMPFLQEALRSIWGRQPWYYLSLDDDLAAGGTTFGVREAIRRRADTALALVTLQDPAHGERIARAILLRLVQFGEGVPNTRRQLRVDELIDGAPDPDAFRAVYDILKAPEQRILTVGARRLDDGTFVDVADLSHDAILSGWPTLRGWIEDHQRIEQDRRRWLARTSGSALTGIDLAAAERWLAEAHDSGAFVEGGLEAYITDSRAAAERAAADQERQRIRKRRRLVGGLVAAVVVALVTSSLTVLAVRAQRAAEAETDRRVATQLQTSAPAYAGGLALQALLVRAADVIDETDLGTVEMLVTAERDPPIAQRIDATTRNVGFEAAAMLDDGRIVIGDGVGGLFVWEQGASAPSAATALGHGVLAVAARPGSSVVAVTGGNVDPDGRDFVGRDGWVDIIDASDPDLEPARVRLATDSPVSAALFLGDQLVVGTWDGSVAFIDVSDPARPVATGSVRVPGRPAGTECDEVDGTRRVRALAVDDGGSWLAAGANHCVIGVWRRETLEPAGVLLGHTGKVRALSFVPGSTRLLSTGDDSTVRSWDLASDEPVARVLVGGGDAAAAAPEARIVAMCIAPDGSAIVTAGRDHRVRRWTLVDGDVRRDADEFVTHTTTVRGVACPTATTFMSIAGDGLVVWDLTRSNRWGRTVLDAGTEVTDVMVAPRPEVQVAVAAGELQVVDAAGSVRELPRTDRTGEVAHVAFADDGRHLAAIGRGVAGWPDEILVFDTVSLDLVARHPAPGTGRFTSLDAIDDRTLVAGANERELVVVRDGTATSSTIPTGRSVTAVALGPSGHVVAGDEGGTLMCGHPGSSLRSIELGRRINDIAVGADGTVAVGTADGLLAAYPGALAAGTAQDCDPARWSRSSPPITHDEILSVDVTGDGDLLLAATSDGAVEIWDLPRLRLIGTLTLAAGEPARHVSVEPGASLIVVAGEDTVVTFDVDRDGLRQRLCEIAQRNLTPDEEEAFLPAAEHRELARCVD